MRLSLILKISGNVCIVIVCYPVCDVMNSEVYLFYLILKSFYFDLIFLTKPISYMIKNSEQKFKYLKNKKSF